MYTLEKIILLPYIYILCTLTPQDNAPSYTHVSSYGV